MAEDTNSTTETPETPALEPKAVIPVNSPFYQVAGGQVYQINAETTASQVRTQDGLNVEIRLGTLERALSGKSTIRFAETCEAMEALSGLLPGDAVIVADATADETVEKGGARYIYQSDGTFRKVSEDESMDIEFKWDLIEDRPESDPKQIDLAVAKQHTHENIETLAGLSDDGDGLLLFKNKRVTDGRVWIANVESLADIPVNIADKGIVFVFPTSESAQA